MRLTSATIEIGVSFGSPYQRVVAAFEYRYITGVYAAATVALGMHLRHGI